MALPCRGKGACNWRRKDQVLPGQWLPQVSGEDSGACDVREGDETMEGRGDSHPPAVSTCINDQWTTPPPKMQIYLCNVRRFFPGRGKGRGRRRGRGNIDACKRCMYLHEFFRFWWNSGQKRIVRFNNTLSLYLSCTVLLCSIPCCSCWGNYNFSNFWEGRWRGGDTD